ncbi:MAG: hypothetical protein JSS81_00670 [Acidobacteria bacterium]|nr:hypothetical protein [Acidobacteriota bacterium]
MRLVVYGFVVLLFCLVGPAAAQDAKAEKAAARAAEVRQKVKSLGTGEKVRISVDLSGGGDFKGYLSEANDASFTVVGKNSQSRTFAYTEVRRVTKKSDYSKGMIAAIAGAAAGGIVALLILLKAASD